MGITGGIACCFLILVIAVFAALWVSKNRRSPKPPQPPLPPPDYPTPPQDPRGRR